MNAERFPAGVPSQTQASSAGGTRIGGIQLNRSWVTKLIVLAIASVLVLSACSSGGTSRIRIEFRQLSKRNKCKR